MVGGPDESEAAAVLAAFVYARDGIEGYLWPLITEALRTAETIAARLEGESRVPAPDSPFPTKPAPAQQRSAPPDPPVVPQERVEAIRAILPPPVVPRSGRRTVGQWIGPDGTAEPITSGFDRRSALVQGQLARMGWPEGSARSGDVEQKPAAHMVALTASFDADSDESTIVETAADLDRVLDTVSGWEGRVIVQLRIAGPVGARVWFSKATPGPEWSAADRILYYYMNCDTEYPADSEIPLDVVRRAAHEFMETNGQRPTSPVWHSPPSWYPMGI